MPRFKLATASHCFRGHDLRLPGAIYVKPNGDGQTCDACRRDRGKEKRERERARTLARRRGEPAPPSKSPVISEAYLVHRILAFADQRDRETVHWVRTELESEIVAAHAMLHAMQAKAEMRHRHGYAARSAQKAGLDPYRRGVKTATGEIASGRA